MIISPLPTPAGDGSKPTSTFAERARARQAHHVPLPVVTEALRTGLGKLPYVGPHAEPIATTLVPQTWSGLAMELAGLTPLRALARAARIPGAASLLNPGRLGALAQRGVRLLTTPAVGAGVAAATGEDPSLAAAQGALGQTIGELGSAAGGAVTRYRGQLLNRLDIAAVSRALGRLAPDAAKLLGRVTSASHLQDVMTGGLFQRAISRAYNRRLKTVVGTYERGALAGGAMITKAQSHPVLDVPTLKLQGVTLDDALTKLRQVREGGWLPEGLVREGKGGAQGRALYEQAATEIHAQLAAVSPLATALYDEMQRVYRQAVQGLHLFEHATPDRVFLGNRLDMDALRDAFGELQPVIQRSTAPGAYRQLHGALFRGATTAERDVARPPYALPGGGFSVHPPGVPGTRSWIHLRFPPRYIGALPPSYRLGQFPTAPFAVPALQALEAFKPEPELSP